MRRVIPMQNKRAVQFRKNRKVAHEFQRLKYCKSCGSYSVLFENQCGQCKAKNPFVSLQKYADTLNHRLAQAELFTIGAALCASIVLAQDLTQLAVAISASAALIALYLLLMRRYKPYYETYRLQKIVMKHAPVINASLVAEAQQAIDDMNNGQFKEAYEKLREVGGLLQNERIKELKVACLNRFIIRKDMELELESVMPSRFDPHFANYLFEVSKVNKQLFRQNVLGYAAVYRQQIEQLPNGKEIMTNVAAAAIRMRHYIVIYQSIIIDYLELLPRDRFLRLCKMLVSTSTGELDQLKRICKEKARIHYGFDPDFQEIWQEG